MGFDTIVAVTQNNINGSFKSLFGAKDGIQPTISIKNRRIGELDATISPPTVRLNVKNEPSKANFSAGTEARNV